MYAHCAIAAADSSGFIVHGGRHVDGDLSEVMWFFDLRKRSWRKLPIHLMHHTNPAPPFFHAMAAVPIVAENAGRPGKSRGATAAVIVGGSVRSPVLLCSTDSWLVIVDPHTNDQLWKQLPALPYGFHYHQVVVHQQAAYITGGHLCSEVKQHTDLPHLYLNHVLRLDLSFWLDETTSGSHHSVATNWRYNTSKQRS